MHFCVALFAEWNEIVFVIFMKVVDMVSVVGRVLLSDVMCIFDILTADRAAR